jgi:hypothetical protein
MEENTPDYTFDMDIAQIRLLYECVAYRIRYWEGSPARPPEEQEHLWKLRDGLYSAILDYNFHNL